VQCRPAARAGSLAGQDGASPIGDAAPAPASKPTRRKKRRKAKGDDGGGKGSSRQQFSYSVSYFTWAVSSSEEEDSDDECPTVTLPLSRLSLTKRTPNYSVNNGCRRK